MPKLARNDTNNLCVPKPVTHLSRSLTHTDPHGTHFLPIARKIRAAVWQVKLEDSFGFGYRRTKIPFYPDYDADGYEKRNKNSYNHDSKEADNDFLNYRYDDNEN